MHKPRQWNKAQSAISRMGAFVLCFGLLCSPMACSVDETCECSVVTSISSSNGATDLAICSDCVFGNDRLEINNPLGQFSLIRFNSLSCPSPTKAEFEGYISHYGAQCTFMGNVSASSTIFGATYFEMNIECPSGSYKQIYENHPISINECVEDVEDVGDEDNEETPNDEAD